MTPALFKQSFGTNATHGNAFGKCVSIVARAQSTDLVSCRGCVPRRGVGRGLCGGTRRKVVPAVLRNERRPQQRLRDLRPEEAAGEHREAHDGAREGVQDLQVDASLGPHQLPSEVRLAAERLCQVRLRAVETEVALLRMSGAVSRGAGPDPSCSERDFGRPRRRRAGRAACARLDSQSTTTRGTYGVRSTADGLLSGIAVTPRPPPPFCRNPGLVRLWQRGVRFDFLRAMVKSSWTIRGGLEESPMLRHGPCGLPAGE